MAAIQSALPIIDKLGPFFKLNFYFIAARLCAKADDSVDLKTCNDALEEAFRTSEQDNRPPLEVVRACVSILDLMGDALVPIEIPLWKPATNNDFVVASNAVTAKNVLQADYVAAEKLRLRGLALADRLSESAHLRRLAHRDMALWYAGLGKQDDFEREKQTLFELVGVSDDAILYPKSGTCGIPSWWTLKAVLRGGCGMG